MNASKVSQTESIRASKRKMGYGYGLGCFMFLVGLPIFLYYGYCSGLWGTNSLLLQYLFQCQCSAASEAARYPEQVELIVSACRHVNSRLLPSGNLLYVREEISGINAVYLLDLHTGERVEVTNQAFSSFLTDELWFLEKGIEDIIIDRSTGTQFQIRTFRFWQDNTYINGKPNLDLLVGELNQAEHVFFDQESDTVTVLSPNFRTNIEQNFTFGLSDIPGWDPDRVEEFLQENDIKYQIILPNFPHEVVSPDGKLIARDDGIYLVENNQMIVKAPPSLVKGWTEDGLAVIYASSGRCLIRSGLPFSDDIGCAIEVPQPVLKLKVPKEYVSLTEMP